MKIIKAKPEHGVVMDVTGRCTAEPGTRFVISGKIYRVNKDGTLRLESTEK